jgi:hypothetical protein
MRDELKTKTVSGLCACMNPASVQVNTKQLRKRTGGMGAGAGIGSQIKREPVTRAAGVDADLRTADREDRFEAVHSKRICDARAQYHECAATRRHLRCPERAEKAYNWLSCPSYDPADPRRAGAPFS